MFMTGKFTLFWKLKLLKFICLYYIMMGSTTVRQFPEIHFVLSHRLTMVLAEG